MLKFVMSVPGTENKIDLSEKEFRLIAGGIYYAMIKDSITERQKRYKLLLRKLNKLTGRY